MRNIRAKLWRLGFQQSHLLFVGAIIFAGWLVLLHTDLTLWQLPTLGTIIGFAGFTLLAELFLIRFPINQSYASSALWVSVSTPLVCAVIALYGTGAGIWVDGAVTLLTGVLNTWLRQSRLRWTLFNTGQSILCAAVAGSLFYLVSPQGFYFGTIPGFALLLAMTTYMMMNGVIIGTVMALRENLPLWWVPQRMGGFIFRQLIPMFPLALLVSVACKVYGNLGLVAVLAPYFALRQALLAYEQQHALYHQTIRNLGFMIQRAHPYTGGHLQRVAEWGRLTAARLGLPPYRTELLYDAALLHDLGKIVLDERVLNKWERLTPEEWEQIKLHPLLGAEILQATPLLESIVPWVVYHHERPDGKGYPHGLKGDDIPLEARIIAVIDAFDAMVGGATPGERRKYREPLSIEEALEELRKGAGTQFDPLVVETFEQVVRQSLTIVEQEVSRASIASG